jgi:hypothetical protein
MFSRTTIDFAEIRCGWRALEDQKRKLQRPENQKR